MKKRICLILLTLVCTILVAAKGKKPSIMVIPSDQLLNEIGCLQELNKQFIPLYNKAFSQDPALRLAISKINALFLDRGFPLENLESIIRKKSMQQVLEGNMSNEESGAFIQQSPLDIILSSAQPDIVILLSYSLNTSGPKHSITYTLQGIDSYSNKEIASAAGTGQQSMSAEKALLLEEAVIGNMDTFTNRLGKYFEDMKKNGREVSIHLRKWEDASINFESRIESFNNERLSFIIEDWIADQCMNGSYSTGVITNNVMEFSQVRIPLTYKRRNRDYPYDARRFAYKLSDYLQKANIKCSIQSTGLGEVYITIGTPQEESDF